jgi:hypothetical protein
VLVLENNGWAYSTPVKRQVPIENLADRAKAYGIDSYIVDGNDVADVYTTAKEAVERARNGEGPILIEAKTFRRMGHAQHDPAEYVPKDMRAHWEARDPIALHEKFLTEQGYLDDTTKKEIETRLETLLSKERDFAENSPMPPPELAEKGVYCTGDDCHKIAPKWERNKSEVMPPKASIDASWVVEGFGRGKSSGGGTAPIHFGDTAQSEERKEVEEKLSPETPEEVVTEEVIKPSLTSAAKMAAKSTNGAGKKSAVKKAGPMLKKIAKVAAPMVGTAVGGPAPKSAKTAPKSAAKTKPTKKPAAKSAAKKGRR